MANTGNTQQQINYGAAVNDGNGDPLRTAFIKTDDNFDNVWLAGPVGSNITITNNTVQANNTNGNLILSPNGIGVIQTNSRVVPRLNNTYDLGSTTQKYRTGYFGIGGLTVDGNVSGAYILGNGSQLTGLAATYGNANVVANLAALGSNPISTTGNVTANYFVGNGRQLTGVVSSYGNANVAVYLPTYTGLLNGNSLNITRSGNTWSINSDILIVPTGASWRSDKGLNDEFITSNVDGYLNFQTFDSTSNVATELHMEHGLVHINIYNGVNQQWEFNEDGTTHFPGDLLPQANLGGNLGSSAFQWQDLWVSNNTIYINSVPLRLTAGNVLTVNGNAVLQNNSNSTISTTGNITADYFIGNGSQLTGLPATYGNANVANYLPTFSGNISAGNVSASGNVTGAYIKGNGSELTNLPAPVVTQDITSNGAMSIMTYDGVIKYVNYATVEPSSGNISAGNLLTTGNVSGNYFIGNGSQLTGISTANTGNVTFSGEAVIGTGTSNTVSGLYLAPDPVSLTNDLYLRVRGNIQDEPTHIHFDTGNNAYYNQYIGDDNKYILLANTGNIVINTNDTVGNSAQWNFNNFGTLTLPGGSRLSPLGANLDIFANGGYVNLITADESSRVGVSGAGGFITTAGGTWQFGTTGNLTAPGNISATGNVTGGNLITAGSGGAITMTGGNITGAGNISAGNVSTTGNATAANFFGNGNTLSNVATQVTNSWTLSAGTNTVSFSVPLNGTYSMWVLGNIPNGIVVWNATATVTNNNVPVIGQQFAWYYPAPGNALVLTSIPSQIIGIANTISNSTPAVGTTSNVFAFTIDNNSGNAAAVNYGYTKIS
jgi:hypothetical protein